ncbi:MAG TPA: hypothetical protein VKB93_07555 [Thermoanaerobaculia bacterium]|nr:hypothetical protein [Thermoanaerobaculia bacterium]
MPGTIHIVAAVDVIAALSSGLLEASMHLMDDGPIPGRNQGTSRLTTFCWPGWTINWTIQQLDLQTPAMIRSIRFEGPAGVKTVQGPDTAYASVWSGIVPACLVPGQLYRYEIEVQMARGSHSILSVKTPSLVVPVAGSLS